MQPLDCSPSFRVVPLQHSLRRATMFVLSGHRVGGRALQPLDHFPLGTLKTVQSLHTFLSAPHATALTLDSAAPGFEFLEMPSALPLEASAPRGAQNFLPRHPRRPLDRTSFKAPLQRHFPSEVSLIIPLGRGSSMAFSVAESCLCSPAGGACLCVAICRPHQNRTVSPAWCAGKFMGGSGRGLPCQLCGE